MKMVWKLSTKKKFRESYKTHMKPSSTLTFRHTVTEALTSSEPTAHTVPSVTLDLSW